MGGRAARGAYLRRRCRARAKIRSLKALLEVALDAFACPVEGRVLHARHFQARNSEWKEIEQKGTVQWGYDVRQSLE